MTAIWNKKFTIATIVYAASLWFISSRSLPELHTPFGFYDKILHFLAFAFLTLIAYRAFCELDFKFSKIASTFIFCVSYAAIDELHQHFVPSRHGCIWDFLADLAGILSMLSVIFIHEYKNRIKLSKKSQ